MNKPASAILIFFAAACPLLAQKADPRFVREAIGTKNYAAAPLVARETTVQPLVTLGAAELVVPEEIDAIRMWNAAHRLPVKNGFTRAIPGAVTVRLAPHSFKTAASAAGGVMTTTDSGTVIWTGAVRVENARRLRLHLANVTVAHGTTFWVYGATGQPIAFGAELIDPQGGLYTPTVEGDVVYLEVEAPAGSPVDSSFTPDAVVQLIDIGSAAAQSPIAKTSDTPSCLVDATCVTSSTLASIAQTRGAVAHLRYVKNGGGYVCTGTLLNDKDTSTTVPYLLTAGHCFSDQASASSLEAYWDYMTANCNDGPGNYPTISSLPRSNGSTLLATSSVSDFTFVRLISIPGGRWLLGWDATGNAVTTGTRLHRVSHPFPDTAPAPEPQQYSSSSITNSPIGTCTEWPLGNYIYEEHLQGGTYGGSSGSAAITDDGHVIGQLSGSCGENPAAGCDSSNYTVDGSFAQDFGQLAQYLAPGSGGTPAACVPTPTVACVLNNRFQVQVRYRSGFDNGAVDTPALVKSVTGFANAAYETAFFYFNSPNNIEMMVKMLDQGNANGAGQPTIALLFGSATPLRMELTITDTKNGAVKKYTSSYASQAGQTDFTAFVK